MNSNTCFDSSLTVVACPRGQFHWKLLAGGLVAFLLAGRVDGGILFTNLFTFNGTNGSGPNCLVQGWDGNFYGTCERGGCCGDGTVFEMMPAGRLTTLVQFNGVTNGTWPCGMIQATNGAFYGTTFGGGTGVGGGSGTVFIMTPDGRLVTVVGFNGANGAKPRATIAQGKDGLFYGSTSQGGPNDYGTLFRINAVGAFSSLVQFNGATGVDPSMPYGGLVQAPDGNFYGTTYWGGLNESGTAFRMSPSGQLTPFVNLGCDGEKPSTTMVLGKDGCLYGTSTGSMLWVGDFLLHNCPATVWKLAPNGSSFQVLWVVGGTEPASLMQASDGNFYGTTRVGGLLGFGTIFQMTPGGTVSTLYEFTGSDGSYPVGPMIQGADGNLYGTTYYGGTNNSGTIFRLTLTLGPNAVINGVVSGLPAGYTLTNGVLLSAVIFNGLTNYWVLPVNFINNGTGQWSWTAPINTLPSYQGVALTFGIAAEYRSPAGSGISVMLAHSSLLAGGNPIGVSFNQTFPGLTEAAFLAALQAVQVPVPPVIPPLPLATFILEYPDQMAMVAPDLYYSGGDFFAYSGGQKIGTVSARIVSQPPVSVSRSAGNIILSWRTVPGQTYQVQSRTNLNQGNWVNLGAPLSTTNATAAFTNALSATAQQFYRVLVPWAP